VSRYFAELHRGLVQLGVDSQVLAGPYFSEHLGRDQTTVGFRLPGWALQRGSRRVLRPLGRVLERANSGDGDVPTILHRTYYDPRKTPKGLIRVETVHDMIHEDRPGDFPSADRTRAWKRDAILSADLIVCVSEYTAERLLAHYDVDPLRIAVVHHGVGTVLTGAPVPHARPYLLYVGHRAGYKNFGRLLGAFAEVAAATDIDLVAFGPGPGADEVQRISQLGLNDRVLFVSGDDRRLEAYYRSAQLFVYPSVVEGFGLPPLEAMVVGCPTAVARARPMTDLLGDAPAFFDPHDEVDIVATLTRCAADEAWRSAAVEAGYRTADRFTWQVAAERTLRAYESAVERVEANRGSR
jgi:glycosyltransferase involved in cell wall biosynthesis